MNNQLEQAFYRVKELKKENEELKYLLKQLFYFRMPIGLKLEEYLNDELRLMCF